MKDRPTAGTIRIANQLGLHARAASKLVRLANMFDADVLLGDTRHEINAKSILGVLMLAASKGTFVTLRCAGIDAAEAYAALSELIEQGFGES